MPQNPSIIKNSPKSLSNSNNFKNSLFFPFYRASFCEPLARRNVVPIKTYNEWALDLLHKYPFHAATWRLALPAVEWNHCLLERYTNGGGCCDRNKSGKSFGQVLEVTLCCGLLKSK
jgi:hypothetical protein